MDTSSSIDLRGVGYLQGNLEHHLDHLAPFCSLMGWPLVVTEEKIFEWAHLYYPRLQVFLWSSLEATFEVTRHFDLVVTTLPRVAFDELFFIAEASLGKRLRTMWLPHGNSDKGHLVPWMEALQSEETVLVYGPRMIDFLAQKKVLHTIKNIIPIGNFRFAYFQKHREFYNKLLDSMHLTTPFVLYAPTWSDAELSSSFEGAIDHVIHELSSFPLVVKPHPNAADKPLVIQKKLSYDSKVTWLDHFPPVYPLLERTSHLIGDFSSIGYDFLTFNRPMFFFNPTQRPEKDEGRFLQRYGTTLTQSNLSSLSLYIKKQHYQKELHPMREQLYHHTFGAGTSWELISSQLLEKVKQLDI